MNGTVIKRGAKWSVVLDLGNDGDGKRQRQWHSGYTTKKLAEKARIQLLNSLEAGIYIQTDKTKTTTADFLLRWLDSYAKASVAPLTFIRYSGIVKGRLIRDLGKIELRKLRPDDILAARAKWAAETTRHGKPLSARSILHHHRVLREALGHAVKWQVLAVNPAAAVDAPKVGKADMATLNVEQAQRLLAACLDAEYGPPAALALLTGLRLGEVLGLRWPAVDLPKLQASVRASLQQIKGLGLVLREPKTARSVRTISLSEGAAVILRQIQHQQKLQRLAAGPAYQDRGMVFATALGDPMSPQTLRRHYHAILTAAGLERVRFHDLRHTHATLMLIEGIHPKIVSERLGHATIGITLDTYSHVMPNMQADAAMRLDTLLATPVKAVAS